jgi:hypothetical protein
MAEGSKSDMAFPKIDLTAETLKMKKYGLNIKLLFDDFLEKGTFCSEIKIALLAKKLGEKIALMAWPALK